MDLLRELHRDGATICMVTHDPRYAAHADRSVHLFDGRVVEENVGAAVERRESEEHVGGPCWSRTSATPSGRLPGPPASRWWRSSRSRWASAARPPSSRIVDGVVLRPLPYPDPDRLVRLSHAHAARRRRGSVGRRLPRPQARRHQPGADGGLPRGHRGPHRARRAHPRPRAADHRGLLRCARRRAPGRPHLSRRHRPARRRRRRDGREPVAHRSLAATRPRWAPRCGSTARPRRSSASSRRASAPVRADVWMLSPLPVPVSPVAIDGDPLASRDVQYFAAIARVRDGVPVADAQAQLADISGRLAKQYPDHQLGSTRLP